MWCHRPAHADIVMSQEVGTIRWHLQVAPPLPAPVYATSCLPAPLALKLKTTDAEPFFHPATLPLHTPPLLPPLVTLAGTWRVVLRLILKFLDSSPTTPSLWWQHILPSAACRGQSVLWPLGCCANSACSQGKGEDVHTLGLKTEENQPLNLSTTSFFAELFQCGSHSPNSTCILYFC